MIVSLKNLLNLHKNMRDKTYSNRLASLNEISDKDLITFKKDDVLKAIEEMKLI